MKNDGKNISSKLVEKKIIIEKSGNLCHGWGCSPFYFLLANVLGTKPVAANWSKVQVMPNLIDFRFTLQPLKTN